MDAYNGSGFGHNNSVYLSYSQDAGLPVCTYDMHTSLGSKTSLFHIDQGGQLSSTVITLAQFLPWKVHSQKLRFLWGSLLETLQ